MSNEDNVNQVYSSSIYVSRPAANESKPKTNPVKKGIILILKMVKTILLRLKKFLGFKLRMLFILPLLAIFFVLGTLISNPNLAASTVVKTPINDSQAIDDTRIDIVEAQSTNKIRASGQNALAPEGKQFLVVFTNIENASSSAKQVMYGNYFRVDEDGKKIAPLPLNANFVVPPKASLEKQLIFVVNKGKKDFKLLVGELEKQQKEIAINFK